MAKIILDNVSLDYPIYNPRSLSLRHKLLKVATGGRITRGVDNVSVVRALSEINLEINAGDRIGIIGHNGAGKTTLLRCLAGVYSPNIGKITRQGSFASFIEVGAGIEPELSGNDNIRRLLLQRGITIDNNMPALKKSIGAFSELGDFLKLPVRTYSSGMLMRLIFSVAMAETPEIMIMDEFFSVGDESFKEKANARLKDSIEKASILVFASHDIDLLKSMCNRFVRMTSGTLEEIEL